MTRFRIIAALVVAPVALIAAAAAAADAPAPRPVVTLSAQVSPGKPPIPNGTPLTLRMSTTFSSVPAGGDFVLERADYKFGRGARLNSALFPSCSVARIRRAGGRLSACPKGSKIGYGLGVGRAVSVGITSSGKLTVFNGPRGRTLVFNFAVVRPALINTTFEAPIRRLHGGRYAFELATTVPPELRAVLDGDIVVTRLDITTGATRVVGGRRRGYFEASSCPKHGSAIHGEFGFNQGASATADLSVMC